MGCGLCPLSSLCCFAAVCVVVVFVCAFFQCFSSFSPLCSYVGQALFGHIKIMSVTILFLMKNVLKHGREKKMVVERSQQAVVLERSQQQLH